MASASAKTWVSGEDILLPKPSGSSVSLMAMAASFRSATLGQLTPEALATMLQEGETLFVEHKSDIAKARAKRSPLRLRPSPTPSVAGC